MSTKFAFGPFVLDAQRGTLLREGRPVAVSSKGFQLLQALLAAPGQVLTKADLMQAAWSDAAVEESNLSVQIAALRSSSDRRPMAASGSQRSRASDIGLSAALPTQPPLTPDASSPPAHASIDRRSPCCRSPISAATRNRNISPTASPRTSSRRLTRFRWFFVIARNSSFVYKGKSMDVKQIAQDLGVRYLLEGSVRKSGQRVRISAQLVDADRATIIWAERYDLELTEVFAIQDEIAERVAGAIEPELLRSRGGSGGRAAHRQHDRLGPGAARDLAFSSRHARKPFEGARAVSRGLQARSRTSRSAYLARRASARASFPTAGRRARARISRKGWRPPSRRSISMSAIRTRTMRLRSSATIRKA